MKILTQCHFSHHEIWSIAKEYGKDLCVRGYHIYQDTWEAAVEEMLVCSRELRNTHNWYAVAVEKNSIVTGHLPRKVAHG